MFTPIFTAEYDDIWYGILLLVRSGQLSQMRPLPWWGNLVKYWIFVDVQGLYKGNVLSNSWGIFDLAFFFPSSFSGITIM